MIATNENSSALHKLKRTSLKQGAILNWISLGLNFSVSFVVTPIIIHKLGSAGFGMWSLIQSFSGYYGLVNLGLASALQRSISSALAKDDQNSMQCTVGTAISFFLFSGTLVMLAAFTLAGPAGVFFEIPTEEFSTFGTTLMLCAVSVVTDFFGALMITMFTARERFDLSNGLNIGRQLIQASGILCILNFRPSIEAIALVVCIVSLGTLAVSWLLARNLYPGIKLSWRGGQYTKLKELLHYGTSTVLLTISNIVRLRLGNIVIAKTSGLAAVGTYSVAANLLLSMNNIVSASLNVLNPRFTRLHTEKNTAELHRLYRIALFSSATMACGMCLMTLIFGERFILFWVGEKLLPSVPILHVLTIAYVFALAQSPSWNLMFALAKHHYMARVTIAEAAIVVILGLWLSQGYGALGFAWATALAMILTKIFLHAPYSAKIAEMRLSEYLSPMSAPFISAIAIFLAARMIQIDNVLRTNGVLIFLGLAIVVGLSYMTIVILLVRKRDFTPQFLTKLI